MDTTLYAELATLVDARLRCIETGNSWAEKHTERLEWYARNMLPSGSGIDSGTTIDLDASTGDKIVLRTAYHHMDEHGGYNGWSEHTVTVRASLIHGITLTIGGRNRNQIKDYLYEVYDEALREKIN
jgi:hypothetical protein